MKVIAFDTAGPVLGVALAVNGRVLARTERVQRGAEGVLLAFAEALLAEAGLVARDLDGVGVSEGPGAFTGLRVGLATAAGLALALDRPLWLHGSLDARAARWHAPDREVLCWLDARKSRVYAARFVGGVPQGEPVDHDPAALLVDQRPGFLAVGEGALVYAALLENAGGSVVEGADDPGVDQLALRCEAALTRGEGGRATDVQPRYVRPPDARPPALTRLS